MSVPSYVTRLFCNEISVKSDRCNRLLHPRPTSQEQKLYHSCQNGLSGCLKGVGRADSGTAGEGHSQPTARNIDIVRQVHLTCSRDIFLLKIT